MKHDTEPAPDMVRVLFELLSIVIPGVCWARLPLGIRVVSKLTECAMHSCLIDHGIYEVCHNHAFEFKGKVLPGSHLEVSRSSSDSDRSKLAEMRMDVVRDETIQDEQKSKNVRESNERFVRRRGVSADGLDCATSYHSPDHIPSILVTKLAS